MPDKWQNHRFRSTPTFAFKYQCINNYNAIIFFGNMS